MIKFRAGDLLLNETDNELYLLIEIYSEAGNGFRYRLIDMKNGRITFKGIRYCDTFYTRIA